LFKKAKYKALQSITPATRAGLRRPEPDYPIDKMRCLLDRLKFCYRAPPDRETRAKNDNPCPMAIECGGHDKLFPAIKHAHLPASRNSQHFGLSETPRCIDKWMRHEAIY
jgi:hypothetical protein